MWWGKKWDGRKSYVSFVFTCKTCALRNFVFARENANLLWANIEFLRIHNIFTWKYKHFAREHKVSWENLKVLRADVKLLMEIIWVGKKNISVLLHLFANLLHSPENIEFASFSGECFVNEGRTGNNMRREAKLYFRTQKFANAKGLEFFFHSYVFFFCFFIYHHVFLGDL